MKKFGFLFHLLAVIVFLNVGCTSSISYPDSNPPGDVPEIFAKDLVSKDGAFEFCPAFTPDGNEMFYTSRVSDSDENRLMYIKNEGGKWSKPALAPFATDAFEMALSISPDGKTAYFSSERSIPEKSGLNIWKAVKEGNKWGKASCMDSPMNAQFNINVSEVNSGVLYLTSVGGVHIMEKVDGKYQLPARLSDAINNIEQIENPFVAPDESYILFNGSSLVDYVRRTEIYISVKEPNGMWKKAVKLDETINSPNHHQMAPYVSPDGKYLFFTRFEGEKGDIYWVDASVLDKYK